MATPLQEYSLEVQHTFIRFLRTVGFGGTEIYRTLSSLARLFFLFATGTEE
jgi:hypothetical protein